jgi:hypothetical protein
MLTNGRNSKNVVVRDGHGRWLKGFSGGPGRPVGSRNKLTDDFLGDLQRSWQKHGARVLDELRQQDPVAYVKVVASVVRVDRVEIGQANDFDRPRSREEILQRLEEHHGPAARKLFEDFLARVKMLEGSEQEAGSRSSCKSRS